MSATQFKKDWIIMHQKTIRIPVWVTFSTDPAELDDRESEVCPTEESLVEYLKGAVRLDVDSEGAGQPEGAVFATAGLDWGAAELVDETAKGMCDNKHAYALRIDGPLLALQRRLLFKIFDTLFRGNPYVAEGSDDQNLLQGIIALLDEIADLGHDQYGIASLLGPEAGESEDSDA